jgi:hypothetical protein
MDGWRVKHRHSDRQIDTYNTLHTYIHIHNRQTDRQTAENTDTREEKTEKQAF